MNKFFTLYFILQSWYCFSQCRTTDSTFNTNVNYTNAVLNWKKTDSAFFYRIRYKNVNSLNWSFQNNIDSSQSNQLITNLTPQNNYIWQIKSYCDSTGALSSNWSASDSFYTENNNLIYPQNTYASNITFYNAQTNWTTINGVNRYKIRYRMFGTNSWSFVANIAGSASNILLPQLNQLTTYEWSIMAYYDTTSLLSSNWSPNDTFTTAQFVPAPFLPQVITNISSNICNQKVDLNVTVSQTANQPDIERTVVKTNCGKFDISNLTTGDTVGYADIVLSNTSASTTLKVGVVFGQNYAFINAIDSLNNIIGFFSIENETDGVKITSTSPPDGNNYTSGLTTTIFFRQIFINPSYETNLVIDTEIQSELLDQINLQDSIGIYCVSHAKSLFATQREYFFTKLGKNTNKKGKYMIITNSVGEKKLIINE